MPQHRHARAAATKFARDAAEKFRDQLTRALDHYSSPGWDDSLLRSVCYARRIAGYAPLSNFHVRMHAHETLIDLLLRHYDRVRHDPSVRHFLFTATFNDGLTQVDAPVVDLARIQRKVWHMLRRLGLNAICVFEIDVMAKPLPGENSRLLMFHVHAVCWTRDSAFKPIAAAAAEARRPELANRLGIRSVDLTTRAMSVRRWDPAKGPLDARFDNPERDQTARSIAHLGHYLLKAPVYAKNRYEAPNGRIRVRYDASAFGLNMVLRLAEIWSQLTPADAVFGVGTEGGKLARDFSFRMTAASRDAAPRALVLSRGEVVQTWSNYFASNPRLGFEPAGLERRQS